jgi:two-component system, LytTR family, sensor kinase
VNWRRVARLTVWGALFWTALGVFFATQIYLLDRRVPWSTALAFSMPRWLVWGALTPAILWVDKKLGTVCSLRARVAWNVPIGVGWTCLSILIRLATRPLRGSPPIQSVTAFFLERFYWDLLIYAVIAGVSISRDYAAQVRDQERQANQLALEAADLERRLVEARLQTLRAQLHPHFLFNALNTISAFTATNPRAARRLMERLGDLLRASLTHAAQRLVTLGEELTFLDDYLSIESARFEERLTVSVNVPDGLLDLLVPSFLLQPIVENAIRHGIAPRVAGGTVRVTADRQGSMLMLRVRDDGVGLRDGWRFEGCAGVGLRNVASRLEHLYGRSDLLRVDPGPSGGVDVEISVPLHESARTSGGRFPVVGVDA